MKFQFNSDLNQNLLIICSEGFLDDDTIDKASAQILAEIKKLTPGFAIINDISKLKAASPEGAEKIRKSQAEMLQYCPGHIIRITKDPIAKMQLIRTSRQAGYTAIDVSSMEEALAYLTEEKMIC